MDFSEQLAAQREIENTQNSEGAAMLKSVEEEEKISEDESQDEKFQAAYGSTDLNNTGPSSDDYDYSSEFKSGNSLAPDEEGGITLSNENRKPATQEIAGHDAVTGERYTSEYESPLISEAITELQASNTNTKTGAPPNDMMPLSKIARGMDETGATYEDFVRKTQGPWSDQQRATAWEGMTMAKRTNEDVKAKGARHFKEGGTEQYVRNEAVQKDIEESELVSSPVWIQSGKTVVDYFNPNGSDGMDAEDIHKFNLSLMSNFNYNIPMMMFYANEIENSKDPELAKSFLFLMDQNKETNISMDSFGRAVGGMAGDITSYMTAGGSVLVSRMVGASMQAGIRQVLAKVMAVTAADSVAGGAVGATTDIQGQKVEIAAGEREEIDIGKAAAAGAIGAAVTATLGVSIAAIADPALRKFGIGQVKGAIDKINPTTAPVPPVPPPVKDVAFNSQLQTEVGDLFSRTKKPKMKVSRLISEIKGMVKNGKIKQEEVDWSNISSLDPKSTVDRAEATAFIKHQTPTPSLDRTAENSFADMSFGGENYREFVINIDKTGTYGGPTGHFGGKPLESGNKVGDEGMANVGHLRVEDIEHGGEKGMMFLEGQSDIRTTKREKTYGHTPLADDIRNAKDDEAVASATKAYRKASESYDAFVLSVAGKYELVPQEGRFNMKMMSSMAEDEKGKMMKLMQAETKAQGRMTMAKQSIDNTRNELNADPFTPFRAQKSSNSLLFRSAVMEAMNSDSKFVAWPKTREQVGRIENWDGYGAEFVNSDRAKSASEFMTKDMKKIAESHGFKVEEFTRPVESTNLSVHDAVNDQMVNVTPTELEDWVTTQWGMSSKEAEDLGIIVVKGRGLSDETMYRIVFTPEQRREWGEKGASMFSWGGAAIVGGTAIDQKRDNDGKFM